MQPTDTKKYRPTCIIPEKDAKTKVATGYCNKMPDKIPAMAKLSPLVRLYPAFFYEIAADSLFACEKSKSSRIFINRRGFAADIPKR
ncbi:MAG: hypothetical protein B6I25_02275 [Planctomycetales bacterium 4572_13]|nr:MAG: hypothetical protein B6I25_02275 [Planctomycetales bacterium 4572_13]